MKKIILLLLFTPIFLFSQTDLTALIFQIIDSEDPKLLLENNRWETRSINSVIDEDQIQYNEYKFKKRINLKGSNTSTIYLTVREHPKYSNKISIKMYEKSFFNNFQTIIKKSSYREISKEIENNKIKKTYRKKPLEIIFTEKLNDYYKIVLKNYTERREENQVNNSNKKAFFYALMQDHHELFLNKELDQVSKNYCYKLDRFHTLYNIDKDVAMKDHKNYLKSYEVVKSNIQEASFMLSKDQRGYNATYILDYEIIRKKDSKRIKFTLNVSVSLNKDNKIYSVNSEILSRE